MTCSNHYQPDHHCMPWPLWLALLCSVTDDYNEAEQNPGHPTCQGPWQDEASYHRNHLGSMKETPWLLCAFLCLRLKLTIGSSSLDLKLWPLLALGSNDLQPLDDGHHWSSIQANDPNFHRTGTLQLSQLELPWPHPNSSTSERRSAVKLGHGWTMADPTKATKIPRFAKRPTAVWIFGVRNLEWLWAEKTATHVRRIEEYCYGDTA